MKIAHHPDHATLMSYAAGSLPEGLAAVVAAHLEMCPDCAETVAEMELIGSALFAHLDAAAMNEPVSAVCAKVVALPLLEPESDAGSQGFLTRLLGRELDDVHWKRLGFGIWHCPIRLSPNARGDLRLIKVAPGQVLPEHGHGGTELTLILRGAYRDEFGEYRTGDLSDLGDEVDHRPISDATEGCICLIASDERARFKDLMARIAQPFTGL